MAEAVAEFGERDQELGRGLLVEGSDNGSRCRDRHGDGDERFE